LWSSLASPQRISSRSVVVVTPHEGIEMPAQVPFAQISFCVHSSPSLHGLLSESAALQLSRASLHDSLQLPSPSGPGQGLPAWRLHVPLLQVSAPSQNAPSSHGEELLTCVHESVASLHESFVQAVVSLQSRAVPAVQAPPTHFSPTVQNAESSHGAWSGLAVCEQMSPPSSQPSSVQGLVSLQSRVVPEHAPSLHVSAEVQNRPSSHGAVLLVCVQVSLTSSHASVVQALVSAQLRGVPEQTPPLQMPSVEQNAAVPQLWPFVLISAGHAIEVPLQISAVSQMPVETRHTVWLVASRSAGQVADEPGHSSATSQAPAALRQTVWLVANASAGQAVDDPEQSSAASHAPTAVRQTA